MASEETNKSSQVPVSGWICIHQVTGEQSDLNTKVIHRDGVEKKTPAQIGER